MNEDTQKLVQEIVAGRRDDDLDDLASAIAVRMKESLATFSWWFRLDGVEVNELDLTLLEWSDVQRLAGVHLTMLKPEMNVDHALAVGRVLLQTRADMTDAEALARVGSLTAQDIPEVFTREVRLAPKGSGSPAST